MGRMTSAMKCPFCTNPHILPITSEVVEHLIVVKTSDGQIHVHGPLQNESVIDDLLIAVLNERIKNRYGASTVQTD